MNLCVVHVLSKMLWKFLKIQKIKAFTSPTFQAIHLCDLATKGFRATGTTRNDRIMKCPLVDVKTMKKNKTGSFNFKSDKNIEIVRWNDNSVVTVGSNAYGVQLIGSAKRWIKLKEKQSIQQSAVIAAYNRGIRGVDQLDCALSDLRPVIRGKKWYWPLAINAIRTGFVYSWRLYRFVSGDTIPLKDFKRHFVGIMIRQSKPCVISVDSRPTKVHKMAEEVRYDGLVHYLISCSVRKCAVCGKSCRY